MTSFLKGTAVLMSGILAIMLYIGCTPGKAQTRTNDYKGSFETEDYESFDARNSGNDDKIPEYRKSDNRGEGAYTRNSARNTADNRGYSDRAVKDSYSSQHRQDSAGRDYYGRDNYAGNNVQVRDQYRKDRFYQQGTASWYGREFHGKVTASGERFDMNRLSAAHKTLPFGTVIEVRNLDNGRAVRVKVNDRGPYRGNRIIDMSYAAARELDMVQKGEAKVGINVIRMGDNSTAYNRNSTGYGQRHVEPVADRDLSDSGARQQNNYGRYDENLKIQAGAFYSRNNADKLKYKIESMTERPVSVVQEGDFYKVRVRGLQSRNEADRLKSRLYNENISSFVME